MSSPELMHSSALIPDSLIEESFPDALFGSASSRARKNSISNPFSHPDATATHPRTNSIPMPTAGAPPKPTRNPARQHSRSPSGATVKRPDSPDLQTILANTPRPRKKGSNAFTPSPAKLGSRTTSAGPSSSSNAGGSLETAPKASGFGLSREEVDGEDSDEVGLETALDGDGSESDSSIDLHTPLPHLMFRDGLLSPRSKLFPQGSTPFAGNPFIEDGSDDPILHRARSVVSVASTAGSLQTKSGFRRDPRDSERRRVRHRDQQLLRMGMGLTTGLGWSDSEDEDAPSTLTRKLIQTHSTRKPSLSASSSFSRPSSHLTRDSTSRLSIYSPPPMTPPLSGSLRQTTLTRSASTSFSWVRPAPTDSSNKDGGSKITHSAPRMRKESSASASTVSTMSQYSQASSVTSKSDSPTPVARSPMPRSVNVELGNRADKPEVTMDIGGEENLRPPTTSGERSESSASTSSFQTASSGSFGSGTSTAPTTTVTTSSVPTTKATIPTIPRPLKLPHQTSMSSIRSRLNRSTSTSGSVYATTSAVPSLGGHQRSNTLSAFSPGSPMQRPVKVSAQRPVPISMVKSLGSGSAGPITTPHRPRAPSTSTSTLVSPTASPPASPSMRTGPLVAGPRPKPRTGTGMVYRTSSAYSSLQDAAIRMRTMSISERG